MAAPYQKLVSIMRRWAAESDAKKAEVTAWRDAAVRAMAEGGDIISGSGNGTSFAKQYALTGPEWLAVLDDALVFAEAGVSPPTRTLGRVI